MTLFPMCRDNNKMRLGRRVRFIKKNQWSLMKFVPFVYTDLQCFSVEVGFRPHTTTKLCAGYRITFVCSGCRVVFTFIWDILLNLV